MTVEQERQYWNAAADSPDIRNTWICDKNVTDQQCMDAIMMAAPPESAVANTVVEIGSGIGRLTELMAEHYKKSAIIGMDVSERMTELAQATSIHGNCHYYTSDNGRNIYVADGMAHFVYSMAVFQHLDALAVRAYMREAYRVLAAGGVFRFQYVEGYEQEPFSRHYSEAYMTEWLREYGFSIAEVDKGLIFPQWTWITAVKEVV